MHPLEIKLRDQWPLDSWSDVPVLLAVSGGADSTALLRLAAALAGPDRRRLAAAHFNHHWRGAEAQADADFVRDMAHEHGVAFYLGEADEAPGESAGGESREGAARTARYRFLRATAKRIGARLLVTAHTADDQAETILHHVLRGTGLSGLAGMPRVRALTPDVSLVRPLLEIRRAEIEQYLADLGQPYRHDAANDDARYTRSRIRHELLPRLIEGYNPEVVAALARLGRLAGEARDVIEQLAEKLADEAVTRKEAGELVIDCRRLAGQPRHLVRELFVQLWRRQDWPQQAMGFAQWDLLADLAISPSQQNTKQTLPGAVGADRHGEQLVLHRTDRSS